MLSPKEVDSVCNIVTRIFQGVETSLIVSIVKRLTKGKNRLSSADVWRMERLSDVNALRKEMLREVTKEYRILEKDLNALIRGTLEKANGADLKRFEGLKESKTDAEQIEAMKNSPALNSAVKKVTKGCKDALNLTGTNAIEASAKAYTDAVNKAYLNTTMWLSSLGDSVKTAVKEIGTSGINIIEKQGTLYTSYGNGYVQYPLDSAVRRDVVTQLNKSAGELTLESCKELDCDLVETTWHLGARHTDKPRYPWSNHDEWQGKVFSISGKSDKYPPFKESTGYGEVDGLCGINCRHSFSPYFEEIGLSDHREFPSKEENERHYKEQQKQRYYERNIRRLKREQIAYRTGGYDAEARETQARLNAMTARYNEFLDQTGRTPITALTEISGYHYIKASQRMERSYSIHATERMSERGVSSLEIENAIKTPLKIIETPARGSIKYIGEEATVVVNAENGKIITTYPTGTSKKKRYKK